MKLSYIFSRKMLCGQLKRPLVAYIRNVARFCASSYRYCSACVKRTVLMPEELDPRRFPADPPPLLPALQRQCWLGLHLQGARTSRQGRDTLLNFSLLLFPCSGSPNLVGAPLFCTHKARPNPLAYVDRFRSWKSNMSTHDAAHGAFMTLPPYSKRRTSKEIF